MQRRALQIILGVLSLIPLIGVAIGFGPGVGFLLPEGTPVPVDLDNQFRYLNGVYAAITVGIWYVIPRVEERLAPLRIVGAGVMLGSVGRLLSMLAYGAPHDVTMIAGLGLEGVVVPLLLLWQTRLHRAATGGATRHQPLVAATA